MKVEEEDETAGLKFNIQNTKIVASSPITSWKIDREIKGTVRDFILGAPKLHQMMTATLKLIDVCLPAPWKKSYHKPRQHIKKNRHYFANKGLYSQSYDFPSRCVWMCKLHHKEG